MMENVRSVVNLEIQTWILSRVGAPTFNPKTTPPQSFDGCALSAILDTSQI